MTRACKYMAGFTHNSLGRHKVIRVRDETSKPLETNMRRSSKETLRIRTSEVLSQLLSPGETFQSKFPQY
ncbi:unnamed protein product [Arabidopsis halleri]